MTPIVRVEFGGPARSQYCTAGAPALCLGDIVVVETEWGVGMGEVAAILHPASLERLKAPIHPVLRKATATDLSRRAALAHREREARTFCRERIHARNLHMKLTEVRIGLDSSKAMFYFTAEDRVDFRELVKDLVQHLRTRVELRQIGVRDEAKILGCAGACGRPVCCQAFLQSFAPVSIRMAKDQNLALNPGKLSGICGRLKCCLAFEHCLYAELKQALPKVGAHVATSRGAGVVRGQNILEQTIQVGLETGGQVSLTAAEVTARPRPEAAASPGRGQGNERAADGKSGKGGRGKAARPPDPTPPAEGPEHPESNGPPPAEGPGPLAEL